MLSLYFLPFDRICDQYVLLLAKYRSAQEILDPDLNDMMKLARLLFDIKQKLEH